MKSIPKVSMESMAIQSAGLSSIDFENPEEPVDEYFSPVLSPSLADRVQSVTEDADILYKWFSKSRKATDKNQGDNFFELSFETATKFVLQTLAPDEYVEDTVFNVYGHLINYASYIEAKREGRTGLKKFCFSNWPAVNILFIFFNYYFNMFYSFIYLTIF